MGACALERVLNWLKTVIRTSPMTSQITRFLTRLFKVAFLRRARRFNRAQVAQFYAQSPYWGTRKPVAESRRSSPDPAAPRQDVHLARAAARGAGFSRGHALEPRPDPREQRRKAAALEGLDEQAPSGREVGERKIHCELAKMGAPGLIGCRDAR